MQRELAPLQNRGDLLPDILAPGLDVIFVGAAASLHSARAGHWYAGPTNRFYLLLHQAGFTPRPFRPEEDSDLLHYRIGLTCLYKTLSSSANHLLPPPTEEARTILRARLVQNAPRFICYNGKDVFQMSTGRVCTDWGEQLEHQGSSRVFVVPSSSARADKWGNERHALYRELHTLIQTENY